MEAYNLDDLTEFDNILHVPADRSKYPNEPAVYVASMLGWYRVDMSMLLFADAAAAKDVDADAEEMAALCIAPILHTNTNPAMKLDNAARLYPSAKNLGGVGTLLLLVSISLASSCEVPSSAAATSFSYSDTSSSP